MTPADASGVVDVAVASGLFPREEVAVVEDLMVEYVARRQREGHACVVDDEDGTLLAIAYYEPIRGTDGAWELLMIGVRGGHQGLGRGGALMRYAEADLRGRGQRLLLVQTSGTPGFERSRKFYSGLGYGEEARVRDYYAPGDDMILFRKPLTPR